MNPRNTPFAFRFIPACPRLAAALCLAALGMVSPGCRKASDVGFEDMAASESTAAGREEYLQYAVRSLNRLDQFGPGEMQPQIVDWLNQWIKDQTVPSDWKVDPLVGTLPAELAGMDEVKSLDRLTFRRDDGSALQEAVWMRDVSNRARGGQLDDLVRARRLFDWVVQNVQLEPDPADPAKAIPNRPWETLLLGRGTAVERAWVFLLLLRHQDIDAAILALPAEGGAARPWAVGALVEGQLYLFDPALGLPIPAPDGVQFDDEGQLNVQPATLAQVAADDALLRQLDLEGAPYPVRAEQLKDVVAWVEGSPAALSARMAMVQSRLTGPDKVLLTAEPSRAAKHIGDAPGAGEARLWPWPFEVARRRAQLGPAETAQVETAMRPFRVGRSYPLWRARTLYFKGELSGPQGAAFFFRQARPPQWRQAEMWKAASETADTSTDADDARTTTEAFQRAKVDASYWAGLVASALGNYDAAADYFHVRTLEDNPNGPWTAGARYNLARLLERLGRRSEAIALLEQDDASPSAPGNRLRAAWLKTAKAEATLPG
ncbi:MAG: hypothetical protein JW809_15675 [Pirellulales bacterium]|nr:hypothetical protein [Pirellulales bacterium]